MESALERIDHIVVLMLENRSFDNMLGWLYSPRNEPPFDRVPRGQPFDGLDGKNLTNPIPPAVPGAGRKEVPVARGQVMNHPNPDPGEDYGHVNQQLFGSADPPDPVPRPAPMNGFVKDYVEMLQQDTHDGGQPGYDDYKIIMDCFPPDRVPVISHLANAYAVCDRWFCSVPSQTMCNRSFANAATSAGLVNNEPYENWARNTGATIFNRMEDGGLSWKVYYDPWDLCSLTWLIHFRSLYKYVHSRFFHFHAFLKDAAAGELPAYSFIEPRFLISHNDQHPPYGVLPGEDLIHQVYQAVRESPLWERTLLIVTYDEHGGCYDHVAPPAAVPPGGGSEDACPQGFRFDRLGVRVPAVLISPWIDAGTVFRAGQPLDHTSIIKTISNRWGLKPLTERDRAAVDLSGALRRGTPRTDRPEISPRPHAPEIDLPNPAAEALSDLHHAFAGLAAAHSKLPLPELSTVGHAHSFVQEALQKLLP